MVRTQLSPALEGEGKEGTVAVGACEKGAEQEKRRFGTSQGVLAGAAFVL